MREIKFRGKKSKEKDDWMYGYLISPEHIRNFDEYNNPIESYLIDKDTIGQFTGLYDKNGKEIYEGDILEWKFDNACSEYYECVWLDEECCFTFKNVKYENSFYNPLDLYDEDYSSGFILGIIGNKFDNPELVEK